MSGRGRSPRKSMEPGAQGGSLKNGRFPGRAAQRRPTPFALCTRDDAWCRLPGIRRALEGRHQGEPRGVIRRSACDAGGVLAPGLAADEGNIVRRGDGAKKTASVPTTGGSPAYPSQQMWRTDGYRNGLWSKHTSLRPEKQGLFSVSEPGSPHGSGCPESAAGGAARTASLRSAGGAASIRFCMWGLAAGKASVSSCS